MKMTVIVLSVMAALAIGFYVCVELGIIDLAALESLLDGAVQVREVKI